MWNTIKQPKHLLALDILGVILASFLMLSFSNSFDKIGTLRDWCFYDNYIETLDNAEVLDKQENFHDIGDELAMQQNTDISSNFSEATAENIALVEEAKGIIRTKLGNQSALHWERFDDIQVKECDIKNIGFSIVLAYYEPEDNTIYCNRAVMNGDWSKDYRLPYNSSRTTSRLARTGQKRLREWHWCISRRLHGIPGAICLPYRQTVILLVLLPCRNLRRGQRPRQCNRAVRDRESRGIHQSETRQRESRPKYRFPSLHSFIVSDIPA